MFSFKDSLFLTMTPSNIIITIIPILEEKIEAFGH